MLDQLSKIIEDKIINDRSQFITEISEISNFIEFKEVYEVNINDLIESDHCGESS